MQESTQTAALPEGNALIRREEIGNDAKPQTIYDPEASNRFEFEVTQDGLQYDTAHVYGPLADDRYVQWMREFKIKGNDEDVNEESREASVRLWNDLVTAVDNLEYDPAEDWKPLVANQEKIDSLNDFLAVAIGSGEEKATGKRIPAGRSETQTILTEAWFNGEVLQQKHVLRKSSLEFEKKYSRIQAKRFKQEKVQGLHKRQPKVEFIPQDEKLGELYDEMKISVEGFAGEWIPLRFKTTVIHHIFAGKLDPKKSAR